MKPLDEEALALLEIAHTRNFIEQRLTLDRNVLNLTLVVGVESVGRDIIALLQAAREPQGFVIVLTPFEEVALVLREFRSVDAVLVVETAQMETMVKAISPAKVLLS